MTSFCFGGLHSAIISVGFGEYLWEERLVARGIMELHETYLKTVTISLAVSALALKTYSKCSSSAPNLADGH